MDTNLFLNGFIRFGGALRCNTWLRQAAFRTLRNMCCRCPHGHEPKIFQSVSEFLIFVIALRVQSRARNCHGTGRRHVVISILKPRETRSRNEIFHGVEKNPLKAHCSYRIWAVLVGRRRTRTNWLLL